MVTTPQQLCPFCLALKGKYHCHFTASHHGTKPVADPFKYAQTHHGLSLIISEHRQYSHTVVSTLKYVYKFTHASYIREHANNVCCIDRSGVNRYIAIYLFSSSLVREAVSSNTTAFQHISDSFLSELATKFNNCK